MRVGTESALARAVFGCAHHPYMCANRRANRIRVVAHDGIAVFSRAPLEPRQVQLALKTANFTLGLSRAQFNALILSLP